MKTLFHEREKVAYDKLDVRNFHALRELWLNRWQRDDVVNNLHNYYRQFQDGCGGGD